MTIFRPCIDIHDGKVKQIVGGTLSDDSTNLKTNFVSTKEPAYYATLYKEHDLRGGHVIKLGGGNDLAAQDALSAWKDGLHVGGGINEENAQSWIDRGAEKVIVTSYLFPNKQFSLERLQNLERKVGKERLVVDISCRKQGDAWVVAMNKWQDLTDMQVSKESIDLLSSYCSELLVHAADVEGLCNGIDELLVTKLGEWCKIPVTYAGGARHTSDLDLVDKLSQGKVDLTYGSALDIFGGSLVKFSDLVEWNMKHNLST